ncbi:MAG: hypothetical protein Q4C49_09375 [Bacillota bacterium]|nr:hypothetical protein [Bacillota bacterium]
MNIIVKKLRFIVPTEAYRGEGLSYYFVKALDYIRIKNSDNVASIFEEKSIPYVQGRVWTTDAMLRETVNLVNKRKAEGCIAVEMEVAGVQAIGDFYHFDLFNFLVSGDEITERDYQVEGLTDANHNLDKLYIALKIVERI